MKFFQKILIGLCSLLPCFGAVPSGSSAKTRELDKKVFRAPVEVDPSVYDPIASSEHPFSIILPSGSNRVNSFSNCTLLNSNQGYISGNFIFGELSIPEVGNTSVLLDIEFDGTPFPTNLSELVMGFGFLVGLYGESSTISISKMGVALGSGFNSLSLPFYSSDGTHALHDVVPFSPNNSSYFQGFGFDNGNSDEPSFGEFPLYIPPVNGEAQNQRLRFTLNFTGHVGQKHKFLLCPFWISMPASSNITEKFDSGMYTLGLLYRGVFDGFSISWDSSVNALDKYYSSLISTGYNDGYHQGQIDGYQSGLNAGKQIASQSSYQNGYNKGYNDGSSTLAPSTTIWALFAAIAGVPTEVLNGMSNLTIWNVSLISTLFSLVFLALILWIIRKFI